MTPSPSSNAPRRIGRPGLSALAGLIPPVEPRLRGLILALLGAFVHTPRPPGPAARPREIKSPISQLATA